MKVKAERYYDNCLLGVSQHFAVRYKKYRFSPWRVVEEPFVDIESPTRSERHFPWLFVTLAGAAAIARDLDLEAVETKNEAVWAKYLSDVAAFKAKRGAEKVEFEVAPKDGPRIRGHP